MTDDGGVVRRTWTVTREDQRAYVGQCTRCVLRDCSGWLAGSAVAGVLVGLLTRGSVASIVASLVFVAWCALSQVAAVRKGLMQLLEVGSEVETVVGPDRVRHATGSFAPPQADGLRPEGRVVRVGLGKDHTHLLPRHVDPDVVRPWIGVPVALPAGSAGRTVVVPPGLGRRTALRVFARQVVLAPGAPVLWALAVLALAFGQWAVVAAVVVAQLGAVAVFAISEARDLDREFPPGIPIDPQWRGRVLEVRSTQGTAVVDLTTATSGRRAGDLFVVRRPGGPPLLLPDVVLSDDVRAELLGGI